MCRPSPLSWLPRTGGLGVVLENKDAHLRAQPTAHCYFFNVWTKRLIGLVMLQASTPEIPPREKHTGEMPCLPDSVFVFVFVFFWPQCSVSSSFPYQRTQREQRTVWEIPQLQSLNILSKVLTALWTWNPGAGQDPEDHSPRQGLPSPWNH